MGDLPAARVHPSQGVCCCAELSGVGKARLKGPKAADVRLL